MLPSLRYLIPVFISTILVALAALATPCRATLILSADTSSINFGSFLPSDLNLGFKEITSSDLSYAMRLTVMDDVSAGWVVKTKAETAYFSSPYGNKPCGDIRWRLNGSDMYTPFSTNDSTMISGDGDLNIDLDFEVLAGWTDAPGIYSTNVVFTIFEN